MRRLIAIAGLLLATACAHGPVAPAVQLPRLHLAPAALGRELSVQQQLRFESGVQRREMDALLEVDAGEVRLLVQAMGQSGVRLSWDGTRLQERRAPWLPPFVRAERVLDDMQFALWPEGAIRDALSGGWSLEVDGHARSLVHGGRAWLRATRLGPSAMQLENLAEGYRLDIASVDAAADP